MLTNAMVLVLRFVFGAFAAFVLVAFVAFIGYTSLWLTVALPVGIGLLAVAYGDRFIVRFLRIFRWLS